MSGTLPVAALKGAENDPDFDTGPSSVWSTEAMMKLPFR